jgi:hypothetical protein
MASSTILTVNNADNQVVAYLNGQEVYNKSTESNPTFADTVDLTNKLIPGKNILLLVGINWGGPAIFKGSLSVNDQVTNWESYLESTPNGLVWSKTFELFSIVLPSPLPANGKIKLKSWKGDYLHRPDSAQGVTSWSTGVGNEWTAEPIEGNKIKLKSWKGDYLHRPDSAQGVTSWSTGVGNEWIVEPIEGNKIKLKSWKGDYLHRPDSAQGVTSWSTGVGNEWIVEAI